MPSTWASGTQVATVGTEHFTSSPSAAGSYVFTVDTNAMSVFDVLELRAYKMAISGGTARVYFVQMYTGVQADDDKTHSSVPVVTSLSEANAIRFSLKQTGGASGRSFPWIVESL